ncbi:hypothetical protein IID24_00235 [Patescibacteria group bacterium]|nr:hypothetical protein [Patescibacteria group bacterium]
MAITAADRERVASEKQQEIRTQRIVAEEIPPDNEISWGWGLDQPGPYNMWALRLHGILYDLHTTRRCFVLRQT